MGHILKTIDQIGHERGFSLSQVRAMHIIKPEPFAILADFDTELFTEEQAAEVVFTDDDTPPPVYFTDEAREVADWTYTSGYAYNPVHPLTPMTASNAEQARENARAWTFVADHFAAFERSLR